MKGRNADRIRKLRERAEQLRIRAMGMKYVETRTDTIAVAGSYDRLADELDGAGEEETRRRG
jgi:hypothetical protein